MLGNRHYNDAWQKVNHLPASRDFRFQAEFSHLAKKLKMAKICFFSFSTCLFVLFLSFLWWKYYEISLLGSSMVMKKCEGCLNVFNLQNPVYSQIWLNCLLDDRHSSYIIIKK